MMIESWNIEYKAWYMNYELWIMNYENSKLQDIREFKRCDKSSHHARDDSNNVFLTSSRLTLLSYSSLTGVSRKKF